MLLTVIIPAIRPEGDPRSTETITVMLYVVDRKDVWLDIDGMGWALRFLHMQFALRGVPGRVSRPPGARGANQIPRPLVMGRRGPARGGTTSAQGIYVH